MFINFNVSERQLVLFYEVRQDNLSHCKYQTQQPNQQHSRLQGNASQKIINFQHYDPKNFLQVSLKAARRLNEIALSNVSLKNIHL
jgi:hypothetical protein